MDLTQANSDPLLQIFAAHEAFCKVLLDAYVLVSPEGKIIKCNQMLAQVTGVKTKQILKANSLDEIIRFEHHQSALKIEELFENTQQNVYFDVIGTPVQSAGSNHLDLSLGVSHLIENGKKIGLFMVLRDITAEKALLGKYAEKAAASERDALTGLYNRRFLEQALLALDEKTPTDKPAKDALLILDIDFFKKINDGDGGHQAGDAILKSLGGLIKSTFRKSDIPARYGGEEFVVILPGTDSRGAALAAEKFRLTVESFPFRFEEWKIPVTISIGVTGRDLFPEASGEQLLGKADEALYAAKHGGRNQVNIHGPDEIVTLHQFLGTAA